MSPTFTPGALYIRVSDKTQEEGYSIPEQIRDCLKYAEDNGITIAEKPFVDAYTGTSLDRPQWMELKEAVKSKGIKVVVVLSINRFARSAVAGLVMEREIVRMGARMEYVKGKYEDTPQGRFLKTIELAIAEYEREMIIERTKSGRMGKARSGYVVVSKAPYGYTAHSDNKKQWLEIFENEARIVRFIVRWYIYGDETGVLLSIRQITNKLTEMGVPTRGDQGTHTYKKQGAGVWNRSTVHDILINETYAGKWHYFKTETHGVGDDRTRERTERKNWVEVEVPAIISAEEHDLIKQRLQSNLEINRGRPSKRFNLLKGLLRCNRCQRSMRGNYQPGRPKKDGTEMTAHWSYVCTGTDEVPKICSMPAFNGDRVENEVWNWLVSLLTNPELVESKLRARQQELSTINAPHLDRIETIDSLITEKREERNRYIGMAGKKIITEDELEVLAGRLLKEIGELEQQKARTQEKIEQPFSDAEIAAIVTDSRELAKTRELFLNASDELKRRNLERYRVRVELEAPEDKVRIAHVECVLGSNTLDIPFGKTFIPAYWCLRRY
jgi:site-specific DNA recombinase